MIQEAIILLWVQHLEQSACGVAVDATANLVNFIDQNQGVLCSNPFQGLYDLAR
jgi:hypothetical protein